MSSPRSIASFTPIASFVFVMLTGVAGAQTPTPAPPTQTPAQQTPAPAPASAAGRRPRAHTRRMHRDRARGAAAHPGDARRLCRGALSRESGLLAAAPAAQRRRERDAKQHPDRRHQRRGHERDHHANATVRRQLPRPGSALAAPLRLRQESGGDRRGAKARGGRGRGRRAPAAADLLDGEGGVHEYPLQPAADPRAGAGGRARRAEPEIGQGILRRGHAPQIGRRARRGGRGECPRRPHQGTERAAPGARRAQHRDGDRRGCADPDRRQPDLPAGDDRSPEAPRRFAPTASRIPAVQAARVRRRGAGAADLP